MLLPVSRSIVSSLLVPVWITYHGDRDEVESKYLRYCKAVSFIAKEKIAVLPDIDDD